MLRSLGEKIVWCILNMLVKKGAPTGGSLL